MNKYTYPKCDGNKVIRGFSHILGGVCFHCGGAGFIMQKHAPTKSLEFEISFLWDDPADVNYMIGGGSHGHKGYLTTKYGDAVDKASLGRIGNLTLAPA